MHMIRKKRNEKSSVIPVRPPAPSVDEVLADVQGADSDDFVFTSGLTLGDDDSLEAEWSEMLSAEDTSEGPDLKRFAKVDEKYKKILKFVRIHESLKSELQELEKSSEQLIKSRELIIAERSALEKKLEKQQSLMKISFKDKST